jgi:hypothetical protein
LQEKRFRYTEIDARVLPFFALIRNMLRENDAAP